MAISTFYPLYVINKSMDTGGGDLDKQDQIILNELKVKIQQHEHTISQLVEIIAATNKRITEVANKQDNNKEYTFT